MVFFGVTMLIFQDMRESAVRESESVLESVAQVFDFKLDMMQNNLLELSYNETLRNVVMGDFSIQDISEILNVSNRLVQINEQNDYVLIFDQEEEKLLSTKGVYDKVELIYGDVFQYGELDYEAFQSLVLQEEVGNIYLPNVQMKMNSITFPAILYLKNINYYYTSKESCLVLYFLDTSFLEQKLETYSLEMNAKSAIYTKSGDLLFSTDGGIECFETESIDQLDDSDKIETCSYSYDLDDNIYTVIESEIDNLFFVTELSKSELYQPVIRAQLIIAIVLAIYLALGLYMSWYLSRRNLKPIRKMIDLYKRNLGDKELSVNEYEILEDHIKEVIAENSRLIDLQSDYSDKIREIWFMELLSGKYNTKEELEEGYFDDFIGAENFVVLVIDISEYILSIDEYNELRNNIKKSIARLSIEELRCAELNLHQLGVMIYFDKHNNQLEKYINTINEHLQKMEQNKGEIKIGIGEPVEDALQIGYSFVQAKCAVRGCFVYGRSAMRYECLPREEECYYFPDQLREMLLTGTNSGNLKQVASIFKVLDVENFESRELNKHQLHQFIDEIRLIVVHLKNQGHKIEDPILKRTYHTEQECFYAFSQMILSSCRIRAEEEISEKRKIEEELLEYIDANFRDSELCLSKVATNFKITESYLSYLFKKFYNVNFSAYLEQKRIEEAKLLLLEGGYTIDEICKKVGYNSAHVFRRAFRKITGMNPSEVKRYKAE